MLETSKRIPRSHDRKRDRSAPFRLICRLEVSRCWIWILEGKHSNCVNLVDKTFKIFVIAESFEWALATFHLANSRTRRVCRPQTRLGVHFGWGRFWARGWWWIRCILHYCRRRLYFLSCIRKEKLPGNCKIFSISFLNTEFLISYFFQDAYRFAKRIETALADIRKMHENQANSNLSVK